MLKKIVFETVIIFVIATTFVMSADKGGMPQLDPEFWLSQIFWLIASFGTMFVVLSKIVLPKISSNLESRKSQILTNIETAENQRKQTEEKIKEFDNIILESHQQAKLIVNQNKKRLNENLNKKREMLEEELNNEIMDAENEILELRKKSPEKINKIATETSSDLLNQIIGVEVNKSNITAIVEDLSKKDKDKYYGI